MFLLSSRVINANQTEINGKIFNNDKVYLLQKNINGCFNDYYLKESPADEGLILGITCRGLKEISDELNKHIKINKIVKC